MSGKMEATNILRNSAHLYDLDQRDIVTTDIPFYLEYAKGASGNILELGCGTGRVAIPLAQAGHNITGLDLSDSMLGVFHAKLAGMPAGIKDKISIVHGNMASFSLGKKFDMIITPFRAFQALTRDDDINGCLNCVHSHLTENGIFIINVFRPFKILDESWCYPETIQWERLDEATGSKVVKKHWGERIDVANQIIYPNFAYEVIHQDDTIERFVDRLSLKYYYFEQLKKILQDAGFHIINEYGWYDKSAIENGRELIFVCKAKQYA